jgi:hypothetical protein
MAFIRTPNTVKVTANYQDAEEETAVNVLHCTYGLSSFDTIASTAYGVIYAWYLATWRALITSNWRLNSVEVRDLDVADGEVVILPTPTGFHGTGGDTPDLSGAAMTVTWQTGHAGKSKRGRTYAFGMPPVAHDAKVWTEGEVTDVTAAYNDLLSAFVSADLRMQVASYQAGGVPRTEAQLTEIIIGRGNFPVNRQWRRMKAP